MLTSPSQYLRPEYLSPLPTTLDAKKSPLALLAQTCSNIGADNPNNKPILSGLEKSKDNSNDSKKDKSPVIISDDHSNSKPSFKPYESVIKKDDNTSSEFCGKKTPNSKTSSPAVHRSSPAASISSCGKLSPSASENERSSSRNPSKSESGSAPPASSPATTSSSTTLCSSQNTLSGLGYGSAGALGLDLARGDASKDSLNLGLSAYKALNGLNTLSNCCVPVPGHPMDAHAYQGAAQSGLLKAGGYPLGSAIPPYAYARVKTANGGTTLVPYCRDPFCTNCQFSMHSAQLSSCPSGCTQCSHDRLGASLQGLGHGLVPGLGSSAAAMAAVAAAGSMGGLSYSPSVLARPNVCSWMVGDTYCGKRFSTSEELLQHLRTHTNHLSTSESPLSLIPPAFSLASSSLSAACHMHYSSASSLTSPAGLRRTYPTSLSPVSSLSAANRFHPYKPALSSLPGAPLPQLGHPGLGMYYPYSIYGQRLGPPVHP
jgi:hypothetical protein